jgi:hypothetical protein
MQPRSTRLLLTDKTKKETSMLGLLNGLLGTVGDILPDLDTSADVNATVGVGADVSVLGIDVGSDLVAGLGVHADVSPDLDLLSGLA